MPFSFRWVTLLAAAQRVVPVGATLAELAVVGAALAAAAVVAAVAVQWLRQPASSATKLVTLPTAALVAAVVVAARQQ